MRVTQSMISNGMLLNMNRNATIVNKLYNQISTGKKIQFPSDNPILASRALKFRTNISETEQYLKNVAQGTSWMEVTEAAYNNINNIMSSIRELSERGASDTMTFEDRQKLTSDIASLVEQIGLEMNVSYAGRYVFSGYRTDQPPVFTEDNGNLSYEITQYFSHEDIQLTKAYTQNLASPAGQSTVKDVAVVKLAYKNLVNLPAGYTAKSINDLDAYTEGSYIKETGELVLAVGTSPSAVLTTAKAKMPSGSTSFTYTKTGFLKGELNPQIYFNCVDRGTSSPTNGLRFNEKIGPPNNERQEFELEFSVNTRVAINSNAIDVFSDKLYADLYSFTGIIDYANQKTRDQIRADVVANNGGLTDTQIEEAVAVEIQKIQTTLQDRFKCMLGLADYHMAEIATAHTDLGSRMNRLELIGNRLGDDKVSYTKLMSDNEDIDYMEVIMLLNNAENVYQASLMSGGRIMQITLANYI